MSRTLSQEELRLLALLASGCQPDSFEAAVAARLEQDAYLKQIQGRWRLTPTGALAALGLSDPA
jgi:hypothetical protein